MQLTDKTVEVPLLEALKDDYGGVIVEMKDSVDPDVFVTSLRASLASWRKQGIRGVWIKIPIELSNLVGPAVGVSLVNARLAYSETQEVFPSSFPLCYLIFFTPEGFWYHHAEPTYLMLVYWIPKTAHTIPVNATHRVRIGAFVINDKREVLVVQEKNGWLRGLGVWKFPTGIIEQGEDIHIGAIREVKEETGVDTEFIEVLAFRQSHVEDFGKSELLFICMLRPVTYAIHPQESEIEAAQWMPIEEYKAQPYVQNRDHVKYILDVCLAKLENLYAGFSRVSVKSGFSDSESSLFLNKTDWKQSLGNNSQIVRDV